MIFLALNDRKRIYEFGNIRRLSTGDAGTPLNVEFYEFKENEMILIEKSKLIGYHFYLKLINKDEKKKT